MALIVRTLHPNTVKALHKKGPAVTAEMKIALLNSKGRQQLSWAEKTENESIKGIIF